MGRSTEQVDWKTSWNEIALEIDVGDKVVLKWN
jgi:hypothetical protein